MGFIGEPDVIYDSKSKSDNYHGVVSKVIDKKCFEEKLFPICH